MTRLSILLIAPLLMLLGCNREETPINLGITFKGDTNATFSADGGDYFIYFTSEYDWSVECFDEWISVSPACGTTMDESFVISATGHDSTEDRTTNVTIHLANGRSVNIPITQHKRDYFVTSTTEAYRVATEGGVIELEVDTNLEYTVSLPKGIEWLTLSDTRSVRTDRLCFTATANDTDQTRVAHIVLYDVRYDRPALHEFSIVQYSTVATTNEIQYTTTDNRPIVCDITEGYGATFMLHYWEAGVGRIIFNDIVRAIPNNALCDRSTLSSITLPSGITRIGSFALAGCTNIDHITLPAKVESIGNCAFEGCCGELVALGKLPNMNYATTNNGHWLNGSQFHTVTLYDRVGSNSFAGYAPLEELTLMASVKAVGSNAFAGCDNLRRVLSDSLSDWCAIDFDNSGANPLSMEGADLIIGGEVITSLETTNSGITSIGRNTFAHYDNLTSINLRGGVVSIGRGAFEGCHLESVALGKSVASIGSGAFYNTTTELLTIAFEIPPFNNDCTKNTHWFYGISARDVVVEQGVTRLNTFAFNALQGVETITLSDSITYIGKGAFANLTSLQSIDLGDGITTLDEHAFFACTAIEEIALPEGVTTIANNAFNGCKGLRHMAIPASTTTIGEYAFAGCESLTHVACYPTTPPALGNTYAFDARCSISVPATAYEEYLSAEVWSRLADRISGDL